MKGMLYTPFYDPQKTYEDNFQEGPFGAFSPTFAGSEVGAPIPSGVGTDFLGVKVNSPFGIPAGPLINSNFCKGAFDKGFDICIR